MRLNSPNKWFILKLYDAVFLKIKQMADRLKINLNFELWTSNKFI